MEKEENFRGEWRRRLWRRVEEKNIGRSRGEDTGKSRREKYREE